MMPTKSKYNLSDSHMLRVPQSIWNRYVKRYKDNAPEQARDDLDLIIGVEDNGNVDKKD